MRKQIKALFLEEREKVCYHNHTPYNGTISCTGQLECSMCGAKFDSKTKEYLNCGPAMPHPDYIETQAGFWKDLAIKKVDIQYDLRTRTYPTSLEDIDDISFKMGELRQKMREIDGKINRAKAALGKKESYMGNGMNDRQMAERKQAISQDNQEVSS